MNKLVLIFVFLFLVSILGFANVSASENKDGDVVNRIVEVETKVVPEGIITIEKVINNPQVEPSPTSSTFKSTGFIPPLLQVTTFGDPLYASCANGAEFKFSTTGPTSNNIGYKLKWNGGQIQDNYNSCGGSSCSFTITTSWSAFYTDAEAWVYYPITVWGPYNAYRCK